MIAAVIPAGGVGKRLGAEIPKQFLPLLDKPLILWTLEVFEKTPEIDLVVVSCLSDYLDHLRDLLRGSGLSKVRSLVPGGETRQESVAKGLFSLPGDTEIVLVHDAARPLVTVSLIQEVIEGVEKFGAALAACPARDTIKEVEAGFVARTIPREKIYLAQTPQGARYEWMVEAFKKAEREGFLGTDEASLLERLGKKVCVIPAPASNLKITTPEDLRLAAFWLRERTLQGHESFGGQNRHHLEEI